MRYEATKLYKLSLALPIVVPIFASAVLLFVPLSEPLHNAFLTTALSGLFGGLPYLMLALLLWGLMDGKNEVQIRRILLVSPILFVPIFLTNLLIFALASGITNPLFFTEALAPFVLFVLGFGYAYVALVLGAVFLLKKTGSIYK